MERCGVCGVKVGILSGGVEPFTGKNLYVCNECGSFLKNIKELMANGDIEQIEKEEEAYKQEHTGDEIQEIIEFIDNALKKMKKEALIRQTKDAFITTVGYNFENKKIKKYIKTISSQCVMGTGMVSELKASVSDIFGETSEAFEDKIEDARDIAFNKLVEKAFVLDANAIIGLSYDYGILNSNSFAVMVTGTAVLISDL